MTQPIKGKLYQFTKPTSLQKYSTEDRDDVGNDPTIFDFFESKSVVCIIDIFWESRHLKVKFVDGLGRINWVPYSNFTYWFEEVDS